MPTLVLLLITGIAIAVSASRLSRTNRSLAREARQLVFVVAFLAQVVLTMQLSGFVFRSFSAWLLASVNCAIAGVVWWRVPRGVAPAPWRARGYSAVRVGSVIRSEPLCAVVCLASVAMVAVRALEALLFPPIGFDSLWYHLPSIAAWLQAGHITTVGYSPIIGRYPANTELVWGFPTVFLHSGRLLAVSGLSGLVLMAVAVRALARSAGLSAANAVLAATLSVLTPVALAQSFANYVDLAVAAWVVAAAAFVHQAAQAAARRDRRQFVWSVAWCGVAMGVAVGSKVSAATVALVTVLGVSWIARRSPLGATTRLLVVALAMPMLVFGSSWYIRNLIVDTNPVSPFRVHGAGLTVFNGTAEAGQWLSEPPSELQGKTRSEQLVRSWIDDAKLLVHPHTISEEERRGGLGPFWPLIGLPCVLLAAVVVVRRGTRAVLDPEALVPALIVSVGALGQPYWWWSRFTISLVALGAIATLRLAQAAPRRVRVALRGAAAATALVGGALGVGHFGYPENEWAGSINAATNLVRRERGFIAYREVMPTFAWVRALPSHSHIGLDASIVDRGGFVLFPLFDTSLDHQVDNVDPKSLDRPTSLDRFAAVVAVPGGPLEQALLEDSSFEAIKASPEGLRVFVRRGVSG